MTRLLGIDPGLSGALAIVETIGGVPTLIDAVDMPVTGSGAKARVDVIAAAAWIAKHAPSIAYIERGQSSIRCLSTSPCLQACASSASRLPDAAIWSRRCARGLSAAACQRLEPCRCGQGHWQGAA
jgi:hypothetical protein